jgi:hypothetical protein
MIKKLLLPVLFLLLFAPFALAAPGGADVTNEQSESGTGTSVDTSSIEGGNVTYADVTSNQITGNWAGFFGNVSGGLVLEDASANSFYEWAIDNWDGAVVYAASGSVSDWTGGNIGPLSNVNAPAHIQSAGTDNFTNTFNETGDFNSTSLNEGSVPYVNTWQDGSRGTLQTYALYSTADSEQIWAGLVDDDSSSFKGATTTVDYQILVPAEGSTTYSFYLELP